MQHSINWRYVVYTTALSVGVFALFSALYVSLADTKPLVLALFPVLILHMSALIQNRKRSKTTTFTGALFALMACAAIDAGYQFMMVGGFEMTSLYRYSAMIGMLAVMALGVYLVNAIRHLLPMEQKRQEAQ